MLDSQWYVDYKLENVRMFVNRALSVDDKYIRIATENAQAGDFTEYELEIGSQDDDFDDYDPQFAEYERAVDIVLSYGEIVARAALNEINLIVEYELKVIASFIEIERTGKPWQEMWIGKREKACKVVESAHSIKLENLAGYNEVEEVRKIINAYKHDGGYSKEYEPWLRDYFSKRRQHKLDFDKIYQYIDAAKVFLRSIPGNRPKLGESDIRLIKQLKNQP